MGIELPDTNIVGSENKINEIEKVRQAIQWIADNGIFMIYPVSDIDTLEDLWNGFNFMLLKYRRISDAKSIEIFGCTNQENYSNIKSNILSAAGNEEHKELVIENYDFASNIIKPDKMDIIRKHLYSMLENKDSAINITNAIFGFKKNCNSLYENIVFDNIVSDVCDKYDSSCIGFSPDYYDSDYPMLVPQDMEDAGVFSDNPSDNYYSVKGDDEVVREEDRKDWFDKYKLQWESYMTIPSNKSRINWIRLLENDIVKLSINKKKNENKINSKKQALLELGWCCSTKFSCDNRNKVDSYMRTIRNESMNKLDFVDMRDISVSSYNITESTIDNALHQVFLVYGFKDNKFDFVGYSFESSLEAMYIPRKYSFREEPIRNYRDHNIAVTSVFIGDVTYKALLDRFADICDNYNKYNRRFNYINDSITEMSYIDHIIHIYTYSLLSIFGIDVKDPTGIDFVYKDMDINRNNKKIFILYYDPVKSYDYKLIDKIIERIKSKVKRSELVISESNNADGLFVESFINEEDNTLKEAANRLLYLPAKYLKIVD